VHEVALAEEVVAVVTSRVGDRRVTRVKVRVGVLAAASADALRFCFDCVTCSTTLDGSCLDIESVEARIRCRACGVETATFDAIPLCPCGSADVDIVAGQELDISEVEVC
jgi:hydrogenase nickel incorporation protein HypA/HybF